MQPDNLLLPDEMSAPAKDAPRKTAETRLRNGTAARDISCSLDEQDRNLVNRRKLHKAMIDGAKPFPRDNSGQSNFNLLDGRAIMRQSGVPYYSIFNDVGCYVQIETSYQAENPPSQQWGDLVARRLHQMLERWDGFDFNMQQASYWMRLHGPGPVYFDKTNDWRFRSLESDFVQVPAGSASCVDARLPYLKVRVPYRAHELYGFIKGEKENEGGYVASGWNVAAVQRAIRYACRDQPWARIGDGLAPWSTFVDQFNNNDLAATVKVDFIQCVHLLLKEYSGKVSKFIFTEAEVPMDTTPSASVAKDAEFLFRSIDCYESYGDCLTVFFRDTGDGTWHSVKGYASDAFDSLVVNNQLYCAMIDAARVDSTIILEFQTTAQRDKMDKFQIRRGITKLPVGAKIQQARLQGALESAMATAQLISTKLNNNIGNLQGRGMSREDGKGETVTATEVKARVAKGASLDAGDITLFYGYLDHVYRTIFARAADPAATDEEALRFQRECAEDGVPPEAFADCEVRANRESGYGSPEMRELKLQQLREIAPSLPPEGQSNLLDMVISAIAGPDKVKLLNPREHQPDLENDWAAGVENSMMHQGMKPETVSGMDDVIHLHSHLADATDYLEPIKQAMDQGQNDPAQLQEAYRYTQVLAPHCEEHLARLLQDPMREKEGKMFADQLRHVTGFSGQLRGAVIAAQKDAQLAAEQQQQATALGALDQAKLDSVRTHDQIAQLKAATSIRDKNAKAANDIQIQTLKAAADIHHNKMKAEASEKEKAA